MPITMRPGSNPNHQAREYTIGHREARKHTIVTVQPGEIRGASIKGGERRQLVPGDVMIVPKGVPHWFEAVSGPIDYYAVKVP